MKRNMQACQAHVNFTPAIETWQRQLLCDAQTSGGLLLSCCPEQTQQVLDLFHQDGFSVAAKIGRIASRQDQNTLIQVQ